MTEIMVVDDEQTLRYAVRRLLTSEGYGVTEASGGEECLEKLKVERPDLILLDVMMPDLTGQEVLAEIKKMEVPVPVVMLTVVSSPGTMNPEDYKGVIDYIAKPFDEDDLIERVKQALMILES